MMLSQTWQRNSLMESNPRQHEAPGTREASNRSRVSIPEITLGGRVFCCEKGTSHQGAQALSELSNAGKAVFLGRDHTNPVAGERHQRVPGIGAAACHLCERKLERHREGRFRLVRRAASSHRRTDDGGIGGAGGRTRRRGQLGLRATSGADPFSLRKRGGGEGLQRGAARFTIALVSAPVSAP